jgi:hypothetical protein
MIFAGCLWYWFSLVCNVMLLCGPGQLAGAHAKKQAKNQIHAFPPRKTTKLQLLGKKNLKTNLKKNQLGKNIQYPLLHDDFY